MTTNAPVSEIWGPLSLPARTDDPGVDAPWRDNIFICLWDPARSVSAILHTSASPNARGRRTRFSARLRNTTVEVIEEPDFGSWSTPSITVDGGDAFTVSSPDLSAEITTEPLFALGDFTGDQAPEAFSVDPSAPIAHYQRAARVTGRIVVEGEEVQVDGYGFRDRTWGFRDESANMAEYYGHMWVFPDFAINAMRILGTDGRDMTLGFHLDADAATATREVTIVRDAAGLLASSRIELVDGRVFDVEATRRHSTFWCPMGWTRSGPVLSAYDEINDLRTAEGVVGHGLTEQGMVRRIP
ncbi:MAG: hypothetical protein M0P31_00720 [Solirubrobacteraceae bacterium]|nr:hypothetical protein [Solirubrobacteraceae bacterium]